MTSRFLRLVLASLTAAATLTAPVAYATPPAASAPQAQANPGGLGKTGINVLVHGEVINVPAPKTGQTIAPALKPILASPNLKIGLPKSPEPQNQVLIDKGSYVISYNPSNKMPNWVSWQLDKKFVSVGAQRGNDFRGDKDLPKDLNRVTPKDYLHSGYDMGHLIPSEDRSRTTKQNEGTFLMTNMTPQRPDLNRGPWRYLEDYTRKIATEKGKDVQVIAGGVMPDRMKTIGSGVAVPTAFFKIAVVLDKGKGLDSVDANTEVIAVMMPNKQGILARKWTDFLSTPKDIEKATGYSFFPNLAPNVRATVESKKADVHISSLMAHPE
jgi:endonuclease G